MKFYLKVCSLSLIFLLCVSETGFSLNQQEEQFQTAVKAFLDGFYDASRLLFERFIKDFPQSSLLCEAKLYIAKCYYSQENYPQALDILIAFKDECGNSNLLDEVSYWLGVIYFKGKDFNKAVYYAQKVIDTYPDSRLKWRAYYLAAESLRKLGKSEEAQKFFTTIINECKDTEITDDAYLALFQFYFREKRYSQITQLAEDYIRNFPSRPLTAEAYFYLGETYYAQNQWNKALSNYQRSLKLNPNQSFSDLLYQRLGFTYLAKGDNIKAKTNIDKIQKKQLRLFSQGVYYFKIKDYLQALETFKMFIRDYPQSDRLAEAYLYKADILYEMGRLNDAVYIYTYILENFNVAQYTSVINKAHYGLAWSYLKNGKFKRAIEEFKNTLEYTDNPIVKISSQIHIGDAYQETGKYREALDIYNRILEAYPNTMYADYIQFQIGITFLKKKDLEKAFLALRNLKNNFPSSRLIPQAQYYLAVGYFSREDYKEAKNLLKDFIDKFGHHQLLAQAYYLYGKCLFNEKDYKEALRIFKIIISKFTDRDIQELVYVDMGNTYLHLDLADKAKKIWKSFLDKYPNSAYWASVALSLGGLYEKEANSMEAKKYYTQVIESYKNTSWAQEALLALGHLYWNKNDLEKAEMYFEKLARKKTPLAIKGKFYLAKIFSQKEKFAEALKIYDQLISSSSPIAKIAVSEKAFLLKDMKRYEEAISLFRKAISLGVTTEAVRFSLGICLEKIGQTKAAVQEYLKLIYVVADTDEENLVSKAKDYKTKSFFRIARIYEKEGKIDLAKQIYRKIIALGVKEAKIAESKLRELEN